MFYSKKGFIIKLSSLCLVFSLFSCSLSVTMNNAKNADNKNILNSYSKDLAIPPTIQANKNSELVAQSISTTLVNGKELKVLGYTNKGILGPTIVAQKGDTLNLRLKNNLTEETNIHWHGLIVPAEMDGYPSSTTKTGETFNYNFKINQRAGMYWYHPHPHGLTAKQAYLGLAGVFIVNDEEEKSLNLPSGNYEIPLVIQDKRLINGNMDYNPNMNDIMTGFMGKNILVNGVLEPKLDISTRYYRLRVLNGSNAKVYNLAFSNNLKFNVIGSDGGLLNQPETLNSLLLSPGERVDILVDFSKEALGSEIYLQSNTFTGSNSQGKENFKILKFKVSKKESESFITPDKLSVFEKITADKAIKTRAFDINGMMGHAGGHMMTMQMGMGMHTINNKTFDMNRIDETVKAGTTEIWEFDNSTGDEIHSMHLHNVQFQVLERQGARKNLLATEKGFKDTILLMPKEKVKIIVTFPDNKGKYLVHCHNLEHEDDGMMLNFMIE